MSTTTIEDRLAQARHRIDGLEARAQSAAPLGAPTRIRRYLDTLRQEEATVRAAASRALNEVEERLGQLETRLDVAEHSLDADVSDDRMTFAVAVEAELDRWDAFLERLQMRAATRKTEVREQAEAAIRDIRRRRIAVTERLAQARDAAGDAWDEQRNRVTRARDELERKADELAAKLK